MKGRKLTVCMSIYAEIQLVLSDFHTYGLVLGNMDGVRGDSMFTALAILGGVFCTLRLGSGSFPKPLTAQEEQYYLELSAQGDQEARNILIERNLRLVAHIMKKYYAQSSDQEDLISIGTLGLIKAVSTFDSSKGIRLATYAARCVENEILMYFRSQRKSAQDVSLSDYIETGTDGAALSLMDVISEDTDLFEQLSCSEDLRRLRAYMEKVLDSREQQVLDLRYGLKGKEPLPQREVAEVCGVSRSYISRIEKKAISKLKNAFDQNLPF